MHKTFKDFLLEMPPSSQHDDNDFDGEDFEEDFYSDCETFFKQVGTRRADGLLIRGSHVGFMEVGKLGNGMKVYKKTVRKDRAPSSTPTKVHEALDEWFEKKFGIRARSKTMFCVGEDGWELAENFGKTVGAVFPIDNFKYVWSPNVMDLYDTINSVMAETGGGVATEVGFEVDKVMGFIDSAGYRDTGIKEAARGAEEIMIDCEEYYFIPLKSETEMFKLKYYINENF